MAFADKPSPLKQALEAWAEKNLFVRDWILDAALYTLEYWHILTRGKTEAERRKLLHEAAEMRLPGTTVRKRTVPGPGVDQGSILEHFFRYEAPFRFDAPFTMEQGEAVSRYRERLMAEVEKAVKKHLSEVQNATYALFPATFARDLDWFVRRVLGESPRSIASSPKGKQSAVREGAKARVQRRAGVPAPAAALEPKPVDERTVSRALSRVARFIDAPLHRGRPARRQD